jgi:3-oxoacyl-[acyl-carrier-protein] synthase-3
MSLYASKITGTGSAFPQDNLTNDELSKRVETNDEWIRERTGIRERRISRPGLESEHNSSLAVRAALNALEMAGKRPEDVDIILYSTSTPDTPLPSSAVRFQAKLGAHKAWALDVNAACSGFVFALSTADQYIRTGSAKTALVVGSDVLSTIVNWEDRGSCILFGDGAGVAVLERTAPTDPSRVISCHLKTDGRLWELLHIVGGGANLPATPEVLSAKLDKVQMKGRELFKEAVRTLSEYAELALTSNGYTVDDVKWFVPHQANLRIIEAVAKRLEMPMDRIIINIDRFGNTSSATVPTALDEAVREGRVKKGDLILFDVFGAGLTYGSALIRW